MQKMTKMGGHARCPQCGGTARIVWISQDEKTEAIKCTRYHSQLNAPPTKFSSRAQSKTKKGMVFLVETDAHAQTR
jgi:transposase